MNTKRDFNAQVLFWLLAAALVYAKSPCSEAPADKEASSWGWRGDGSGQFPDASPPLNFGRTSLLLKGLTCKASKPKDGKAIDAQPCDHGQIPEWLVLDPIPTEMSGKEELDRAYIEQEAEVEPDENAKSGNLSWKRISSDGEMVLLNRTHGDLSNKAVLLCTYLHSEKPGTVYCLTKGTPYRLWVNGKEVCRSVSDDGNGKTQSTFELREGWNRVLVKLVAARSDHLDKNLMAGTAFFQIALWSAHPDEKFEEKGILWSARLPQVGYFSSAQPLVIGDKVVVNSDPAFLVCYHAITGERLWTTYNGPYECVTEAERLKFSDLFKEIDPKAKRLKEVAFGFKGTQEERREMQTLQLGIRKLLKQIDRDRYCDVAERQEAGIAGLTSCTDGSRIYTWYANGVAVCHDTNGKRLWITLENEGGPGKGGASDLHGYQAATFLSGKYLVVSMKSRMGINKETGKVEWKVDYQEKNRFAGSVSQYADGTYAGASSDILDFLSAGVMHFPSHGYAAIPSRSVLAGNRVYSSRFSMQAILTATELPEVPKANQELVSVKFTPAAKDVQAMAPGTWCGQGMVSTPLVHDGLVYSISVAGILYVLEEKTLKPVYSKWLGLNTLKGPAYPYPANAGVCASPTLGGKNIYLWGNGGTVFVIKPGREFVLLAKNRLERVLPEWVQNYYFHKEVEDKGVHPECTVSSPVFAGNRIYHQGEGYLYCLGEAK